MVGSDVADADGNIDETVYLGTKLTWQAPLEVLFLAGGLSFNVNYIAHKSETEYPKRSDESLPVTSIPDTEMRFTLNYQTEKIFAQILYRRMDVSMLRVGGVREEGRFDRANN